MALDTGLTEGTRLYAGQPGEFGNAGSSIGPDGLVIEEGSDYQFRRPNPQIRIISKLFWADQGESEEMLRVTINGHSYIISSDQAGGVGGGPCVPGGSIRFRLSDAHGRCREPQDHLQAHAGS